MVRLIVFIALIISLNSFGQKTGFGLNIEWVPTSTYHTVFDNTNFQYLFAAPYTSESLGDNFFEENSIYDQVRIVNINGVRSTPGQINFGGSFDFTTKNDFQFIAGLDYAYKEYDVFYNFQNMLIDLDDPGIEFLNTDAPGIVDESITVSNWQTLFSFTTNYFLPTKTGIKYFVSAGYASALTFATSYSSYIKQNEDYYLVQDESVQAEYYNTRIFQDRLFEEVKTDGIANYVKFGAGLKHFGINFGFNYWMSLGGSNSEYFLRRNQVSFYLRYQLFSIPVFK